jgi:hypothetical protein
MERYRCIEYRHLILFFYEINKRFSPTATHLSSSFRPQRIRGSSKEEVEQVLFHVSPRIRIKNWRIYSGSVGADRGLRLERHRVCREYLGNSFYSGFWNPWWHFSKFNELHDLMITSNIFGVLQRTRLFKYKNIIR